MVIHLYPDLLMFIPDASPLFDSFHIENTLLDQKQHLFRVFYKEKKNNIFNLFVQKIRAIYLYI